MPPYCITVCVCASKAVCSSCLHTALQCVFQQGCLQFMSPYCITVFVPTRLSAVHFTTLHYSVCASKAVCSSCHRTALQCVCASRAFCSSCHNTALKCVCQQGCLQFVSFSMRGDWVFRAFDYEGFIFFDFEKNHDSPLGCSVGEPCV